MTQRGLSAFLLFVATCALIIGVGHGVLQMWGM